MPAAVPLLPCMSILTSPSVLECDAVPDVSVRIVYEPEITIKFIMFSQNIGLEESETKQKLKIKKQKHEEINNEI